MKTCIVLYADEGKILTNGEIYGRQIFLAENLTSEEFYEISEEMYNTLIENELEIGGLE
jgi:hypothetical protein